MFRLSNDTGKITNIIWGQTMSDQEVEETVLLEQEDPASHPDLYIETLKEQLKVKGTDPLDRFVLVSKLGEGGSGIIYKAHDPSLGRDLAVKVLKEEFRVKPLAVERFLREARASSQLEHPNIIPIHELGYSDDLGCYFTMKKIAGDSLEEILTRLREGDKEFVKKYHLINLLEIFIKICQGIAYAHSKNIIHRDLKPENIIVGSYGEVFIIDWGLAKKLNGSDSMKSTSSVSLSFDKASYEGGHTVHGTINGTPCYMSPEQACGMQDEIGFHSDIYCLGTILYETLCFYPPFKIKEVQQVLADVAQGNFPPPSKQNPRHHISKELEAITLKAMATNPLHRYPSVVELINDVRNAIGNYPVTAYDAPPLRKVWRFLQRHKIFAATTFSVIFGIVFSLVFVQAQSSARVKASLDTAEEISISAHQFMQEAITMKRRVDLGVELDKIEKYKASFKDAEFKMTARFSAALSLYKSISGQLAGFITAKRKANEIFLSLIDYCVETKQPEQLSSTLDLARVWTEKKVYPYVISDRAKYNRVIEYMEGNGTITIAVTPEPEQVIVYNINENSEGAFSTANPYIIISGNCVNKTISKGRYIAIIKTKGFDDVTYSFKIDHIGHENICFNTPKLISKEMVFIPPGTVWIGGPRSSYNKLTRKNLPGFMIRKTEVTFREYFEFWKNLTQLEKNRYFPYIQLSENIRQYVTAWDKSGNFRSFCNPDAPVVGITHEAAQAYCRWLSRTTGRQFRLPTASEWEKAARGGDGRNFVWGNDFSTEKALTRGNKRAKLLFDYWSPVNSFPQDVSVYGVVDMAGNAREWTTTQFGIEANFYLIKGGSAFTPDSFIYCESESYTSFTPSDVGFRYIEEISTPGK